MDFFKDIFVCVKNRVFILFKWVLFVIVASIAVSSAVSVFYILIAKSTMIRQENDIIILFLPLSGFFIAFIYRKYNDVKQGINFILEAVHSKKRLPLKMIPLIFLSTIITHLFGGSVGRTGAALQIGGTIGDFFGKIFKVGDGNRRIFIMCGMSSAFTVLFGSPVSATVFSIEVASNNIISYSALLPCAIAALISGVITDCFGIIPECFFINDIPKLSLFPIAEILILSMLCAGLSVLFCFALYKSEYLFKKYSRNDYMRIFAGGLIIIVFTFILRSQNYNGAGMDIISKAVSGEVGEYDFLFKLIFTAITIGAGFRGGEIVPAFFVGATFGCLFGRIIGLSPGFCAAIGLISIFCGVTNCPIASLLIGIEFFGDGGLLYYLLTVSVTYTLSGRYGLYQTRKRNNIFKI